MAKSQFGSKSPMLRMTKEFSLTGTRYDSNRQFDTYNIEMTHDQVLSYVEQECKDKTLI